MRKGETTLLSAASGGVSASVFIMTTYLLMHKDNAVAEFTFSSGDYHIDTLHVIDISLLPFRVKYAQDFMKKIALEAWMWQRIMPMERYGSGKLFAVIGRDRMRNSLLAHAASLTDSYWIRDTHDHVTWKDVSFYTGHFSDDIGNFIFGNASSHPDMKSPDLTTNGRQAKTWISAVGSIFLVKAGSAPLFYEPYAEETACELIKKISITPVVTYKIQDFNGRTCSLCESFIREGVELVTADEIYHIEQKPQFITPDEHLRNMCKKLAIPNYKPFLDNLQYIDYVIANPDRNLGNFGFIYDTSTKKFVGPAPIYDNGSAFGAGDVFMPEKNIILYSDTVKNAAMRIHHPDMLMKPDKDAIYSTVAQYYRQCPGDSQAFARVAPQMFANRAEALYTAAHELHEKKYSKELVK